MSGACNVIDTIVKRIQATTDTTNKGIISDLVWLIQIKEIVFRLSKYDTTVECLWSCLTTKTLESAK